MKLNLRAGVAFCRRLSLILGISSVVLDKRASVHGRDRPGAEVRSGSDVAEAAAESLGDGQ